MKITCIMCPLGCSVEAKIVDKAYEFSGFSCARGKKYAEQEIIAPKRVVTTLALGKDGSIIPCKTATTIDKSKIFEVLKAIKAIRVDTPIEIGGVIIKNVNNLGVDIVATSKR